MTIEAIAPLTSTQNLAQVADTAAPKPNAPIGNDFSAMLVSGLEGVNQDIKASDKALQDFILKKDISTHDLMIAMEKAKHSLQVSVEVRNRLVSAYEQITRMQV